MDTSSIDYAEGRVFDFEDERSIQPSFLETFEYAGQRQRVSYQMKEFAAVCHFLLRPMPCLVSFLFFF